MVDVMPNATSTTSIIHSTNIAVPRLRAELYESIIGTIMPSAKHRLCIQRHALSTHAQSKKLKKPDTAIAMPIAITTQNEKRLSVMRVSPDERVVLRVRLFLLLFAIIISEKRL